jgi:hypothetical protein
VATTAGETAGAVEAGAAELLDFAFAVEALFDIAGAEVFGAGEAAAGSGRGGGILTFKLVEGAVADTAGAAIAGATVAGASFTGTGAALTTVAFDVAPPTLAGGLPASPSPRPVAPDDAIRTMSAVAFELATRGLIRSLSADAGRRGGRGRSSYSCAESVAWLAPNTSSNAMLRKIPFINSTLFLH